MNFAAKIGKFRKRSINAVEQTSRAIKIELFTSVIMDTPVDEGRARGNWQASVNMPKYDMIDRTDKTGTATVSEMQRKLGKAGDTSYLTNNLPYIVALEYGHSRQSPHGMVRKNIARLRRIVAKAIRGNRL